MNAKQAYTRVAIASGILAYGWLFNNLIGILSIPVLIYLIWWKWNFGFLGVVVLIVGVWIFNSVVLPIIFSVLNMPFAALAKSGAVRLGVLGAIDESTVLKLSKTKVEYWPQVIYDSMPEDEFYRRVYGSPTPNSGD